LKLAFALERCCLRRWHTHSNSEPAQHVNARAAPVRLDLAASGKVGRGELGGEVWHGRDEATPIGVDLLVGAEGPVGVGQLLAALVGIEADGEGV